MIRKEQVFDYVNDNGVTGNEVAVSLKMDHRKARALLFDLAQEGRIFRVFGKGVVPRYFKTEDGARRFDSGGLRRDQVLAAITDSGWTVRKLLTVLTMQRKSIEEALAALLEAGKIHAHSFNGGTLYFPTKEAAEAFRQSKKKQKSPLPPSNIKTSANSCVVVKTKTSFEKGAQIIVPPHVQKQECPPFRGLGFSETQPKERAFSSLGIGRYMPDEDAMLRRVARKGAR